MSKKYTSKQISEVMRFVLLGAFEHIEALKVEINKIGPVDEKTDPVVLSRARVLHLTLTCINDIIHPAHILCPSLFGEDNKDFFKTLVDNHALAIEKKLVPECYCVSCDPDKSKAIAKMEKINAAQKKDDVHEVGHS
jgi:hypothetical protein